MVASTDRDLIAFQATLILNSTPEAVRERLLADRVFAECMGVAITTTMHLSSTVKITANKFVEAVRTELAGARHVEIVTTAGEALNFEASLSNGALKLVAKEHTIEHPFIEVLSPERDARLRAVERFAAEVLVGAQTAEHWREVLSERGFTPAEYMDFVRDGRATPEVLLARLQRRRNLDPRAMVPDGLNYWSTLLPMPEAGEGFPDFLKARLHPNQARMLALNPRLACSRIGYSAASRDVVPLDLLQNLDPQDLEPSVDKEDPFSLLFTFEVAANRLHGGSQWEDIGTRVLEKLFGNKEAFTGRCDLLSAGIVIAFARLAQLAEWKGAPLYWRRLAVLSQAGVVADALGNLREPAALREWAFKQVGSEYYWRALTDRREGPLWWTDAIEARTLKAFVAARFIQAMQKIDESRWPAAWRSVAEGMRKDTLEPSERIMMAFPGPLNDFVGYHRDLDREVFEETLNTLRDRPFKIPGLRPFVHLAKLTEQDLSLLREFVVRTALPPGDDARLYIAELAVIAHAAGTYRDVALADALADKAVTLFKQTEGIEREIVLSLLVDAASANAEERTYLAWVAQWFERLAFMSSSRQETDVVRNVLGSLISVDPKYRAYLSRARATLEIKGGNLL